MTAYEALKAQKEAITGDVAAWLQCALDPNHPGAPAADRIVGIYMLADIANAITRIADALERIAEAQEAIAGETVEHNAYQEGYRDAVTDQAVNGITAHSGDPAWAVAQADAPGMAEALEAEYQRGRVDGARQQREADKWHLTDSARPNAATALSGYPLVTDATTNAENTGEA